MGPVFVLCLGLVVLVKADCTYEGIRYPESAAVQTAEPCLRCACARGVLLCYLRVCPQLPDPPPRGCLLLHKHKACCPELICADLPTGNRIEARLDDVPEIPYNQTMIGSAGCVHNGTVYASGSAMSSSTLCEYCYCIEGTQRCVKPRCLLPMDGCTPSYQQHTCCPTSYSCTSITPLSTTITSSSTTTTTTTAAAIPLETEDSGGGCLVDGERFKEGSKVIGAKHSACDNCYCMRGKTRCMPLQCAPPLLGCTPVVPKGECCAASYNCSGVIEVQPKLSYNAQPILSKEYAKLRKEAQHKRRYPSEKHSMAPSSNIPHYVIAETPKSTPYYFTTTPEQTTTASQKTSTEVFNYKVFNPDSNKYSKISLTTTKFDAGGRIRPVFEPDETTQQTGIPRFESLRIQPIYDPNGPGDESTRREMLRVQQNGPVYRATTHRVHLPNLDPNRLATPPALRRRSEMGHPVYTPNRLEATTRKLRPFGAKLTTVKPAGFETLPYKAKFEDFLSPLTTSDEGLTHSSLISRRKFEETTPQQISNYVDVDSAGNDVADGRNIRRIEEEGVTEEGEVKEGGTTETTTETATESTTRTETTEGTTEYQTTTEVATEESTTEGNKTSWSKIIGNNTECIESTDESGSVVEERIDKDVFESTTETTTVEYTTAGGATTDFEPEGGKTEQVDAGATVMPYKKIPDDLEVILNMTKSINKKDEDYEYDYGEPTLPPSLPNLRIIPFVAADAVEYEKNGATYPPLLQERIPSQFSPPVETQGGFVPRDPSVMENIYDKIFHTTGIDITTGTGVPLITSPQKTIEEDCLLDGRKVHHGELTSEVGACSVCLCLFGDVVCKPPNCPQIPPGCRRVPTTSTPCCGRVICNGDDESPTVVIPQPNLPEVVTVAEGIVTPDPFRDVIHTEPAPNLQSLIGDIMPFLQRQTTTTQKTPIYVTTSTEAPNNSSDDADEDLFNFNSVLKLFFPDEKVENATSPPEMNATTAKSVPPAPTSPPESKNSIDTVGLLKLAGCNIYGRMYRVGRIISELSNPCLECMCTEVGVQCRNLVC